MSTCVSLLESMTAAITGGTAHADASWQPKRTEENVWMLISQHIVWWGSILLQFGQPDYQVGSLAWRKVNQFWARKHLCEGFPLRIQLKYSPLFVINSRMIVFFNIFTCSDLCWEFLQHLTHFSECIKQVDDLEKIQFLSEFWSYFLYSLCYIGFYLGWKGCSSLSVDKH